MTIKQIQKDFENRIQMETGATVEITFINDKQLSVLAESQLDLTKSQKLLNEVSNLKLTEIEIYEDMAVAFYAYK